MGALSLVIALGLAVAGVLHGTGLVLDSVIVALRLTTTALGNTAADPAETQGSCNTRLGPRWCPWGRWGSSGRSWPLPCC